MGHERGRPLLQDAASFLASRDLSVEIFFDRLLIFLHLYVSFSLFFFKVEVEVRSCLASAYLVTSR